MSTKCRTVVICVVLSVLLGSCTDSGPGSVENVDKDLEEVAELSVPVTLVPVLLGRFQDCGAEPDDPYEDALGLRAETLESAIEQSTVEDVLHVRISFNEPTSWADAVPPASGLVRLNGVALRLDVTPPAEFFSTRTGFVDETDVRRSLWNALSDYGTSQGLRSVNQRLISENLLEEGRERGAAEANGRADNHDVDAAVAAVALQELDDDSLKLVSVAVSGPKADLVDFLSHLQPDRIHDAVVVASTKNGSLLLRNLKRSFTLATEVDEMFASRPMLPLATQIQLWGGIFACSSG